MRLSHPIGHFLKFKVFSPVICPGFGVWGTLGQEVRGSGWRGEFSSANAGNVQT